MADASNRYPIASNTRHGKAIENTLTSMMAHGILALVSNVGLAQWQRTGLITQGSLVRIQHPTYLIKRSEKSDS